VTFFDVGHVSEFQEGTVRVVVADARDIGVLRWRHEWFAVRNVCPHLGAALCEGRVQSFLDADTSSDGGLIVDGSRPMLMCPWHRWEFDLRTGWSVRGGERVKTHPVTVRDGRVLIDVSSPVAREQPAE
jgi:nitrite reductase (NADH) small subunit